MAFIPRDFITNLWIMVHTLVSYIHAQCLNPWDFDTDDIRHTASASTFTELHAFAKTLLELHAHVMRLERQITRAYNLVWNRKGML